MSINLGGREGAARIGLGGNGSDGVIDVFDAASHWNIRIGGTPGLGRIGLGGSRVKVWPSVPFDS